MIAHIPAPHALILRGTFLHFSPGFQDQNTISDRH
jgi:hypothetical protein